MWFITLLVLAMAAILIIKAVKAHSDRLATSTEEESFTSGLQGSLTRPALPIEAERSTLAPGSQASDSRHVQTDSASSARSPASGDSSSTLEDIREMIKTLNLTDSDSSRLGISSDVFNALRHPENSDSSTPTLPDTSTQADISERLRRMLN